MKNRSWHRLVSGTFATILTALLATVAALFVGSPASAQVSQLVGSPLTTKRLERLLRVYVEPTPAEATALDGIHEAYLDRFRIELDPEIKQVGQSMPSGMPSKQEFERFLRDIDRIQERIAAADKAFFDSAVELVAPERRAGIERIRSARERQREMSGFARMGSMMFGGGGSFVDLPDLLARERFLELIPPEQRPQFDAMMLEQERRTLAQAKAYSTGVRKATGKLWDVVSSVEAGADGADGAAGAEDEAAAAAAAQAAAAQMQRMSAMMQAMREAGEEPRKIVSQNFDGNRIAIRQFMAVLPEVEIHRLREQLAQKSTGMLGGMMAMSDFSPAGVGDVAGVIRRVRRDSTVGPDVKAAIGPIELDWRRERAEIAENLADLTLSIDMTELMMQGMGGVEGGGGAAKIEAETKRRTAADQRALESIAGLLGETASGRYLGKRKTEVAPDAGDSWVILPATEESEDSSEPENLWAPGFASLYQVPPPLSAADVIAKLRLVGVEVPAPELLEAVIEGWKASEWEAKVLPLWNTMSDARRRMYERSEDGSFGVNEGARAEARTVARTMADAVTAADRALCTDLATALDLKPDGPEMTLLRLERLSLLRDEGFFDSATRVSPPPSKILSLARLDAPAARSLLEADLARWTALADELPSLLKDVVRRAEELEAAQGDRSDGGNWERQREVMTRNARAAREFSDRLAELYRTAAEKASESAEFRTAVQRAFLEGTRPDIYRPSDSALPQIDRAIAIDGLTPEQRGRLDALRAEYEAVYSALSAQLAEGPSAMPFGDDESQLREYSERAEAIEKLRFQRNERTEKARSEARRILGDELAKRIRGLVPDEDSSARSQTRMAFNPFAEDED